MSGSPSHPATPWALAPGRPAPGCAGSTATAATAAADEPALKSTDPRWVLALRCREALQGTLLPPDQRDRLLRLGRAFGLTPFEANLVLAIVQDQARRGGRLADAAGNLALVPRHQRHESRRLRRVAAWVVAALALEIALLMLWLG